MAKQPVIKVTWPHMRVNDSETRKRQTALVAFDTAAMLADKLKNARAMLECAQMSLERASTRAEKHKLRAKVFFLQKQVSSF